MLENAGLGKDTAKYWNLKDGKLSMNLIVEKEVNGYKTIIEFVSLGKDITWYLESQKILKLGTNDDWESWNTEIRIEWICWLDRVLKWTDPKMADSLTTKRSQRVR